MLILSQRPDAEHVAGFRAWQKLGRHFRRGEKSITIIAPMVRKLDEVEATQQGESEKTIRGFGAAHVFDVSRTEGGPLPEPATVQADPGLFTDRLIARIHPLGIELEAIESLGTTDGTSRCGRIRI